MEIAAIKMKHIKTFEIIINEGVVDTNAFLEALEAEVMKVKGNLYYDDTHNYSDGNMHLFLISKKPLTTSQQEEYFQSKESGNGVGVVYMTMNDFTKGDTDVDLLDAEKMSGLKINMAGLIKKHLG